MRRIVAALVLAGGLAGGLAPLDLGVAPDGLLVAQVNQAVAKCASKEVEVGSPIDGKTTCIPNDPAQGGAIVFYLQQILRFLSGAIGLVIFLMIVVSGIQYIVSAGDPGQVKTAKNRLVNAITALVLFLLAFAILSFVVPGGIL